jgi:hypothetical protein
MPGDQQNKGVLSRFSARAIDEQNRPNRALLKSAPCGVSLSVSCFVFDFDAFYSIKRDARSSLSSSKGR